MKLQGIKAEYSPTGKIKRIIINANTKSEFIEDLIDTIICKANEGEEQEVTPLRELMKELDKKHNIKR
jgi:hypothetical protein